MITPWGRKDQNWVAMMNPILAKQFQSPQWQRDITIFSAFPSPDVNHQARAVDILNLKMSPFLMSQTTGIDHREAGSIALQSDSVRRPSSRLAS